MDRATVTMRKRVEMPRTVPVLPQEEQQKLRELRESGDLIAFRQRVFALREKKWPLRAIGEPVGAPRSTVRMWEQHADPSGPLPDDVPEAPNAERSRGERVVRRRLDVPPEDRDELKRLAVSARHVRGRTPNNSPFRIDADKLDAKIEKYIQRQVPVKKIAEHMDVTPRAVTARYERYLERKQEMENA